MKAIKKVITVITATIMLTATAERIPHKLLDVNINVSAYTAHTREEAVAWAKAQQGVGIDYDGAYGNQCVDLIKAYYNYLGVSPVLGNGKDYATNSLPSGWSRIQNTADFVPEPGDIVVWTNGTHGHVAIFLYGDVHNIYSMDQNWGASYCKEVHHEGYSGVWGVIRPDFQSSSSRIDTSINTNYNTNVPCTAPSRIYTYDEYGNLEGNRWVDKDDPCIAIEAYTTGFWKIDYPSGSTRRQAYMKISEWNPFSKVGHNPVGYLDGAAGGNGTVTVSGWAYDADTPNEAVEIHIYMDGEAGTGTCVATGIIADKERPDVNNAGYPGNHGFEATIDISDTGTHTFYAHAINRGAAGEGFPNTLLTNNWSTTISELIPHGAEMSSGAGQTIADGYYGIYSHLAENYYLDIDGADVPPANGTNVHVWKHDNNGLPMCDVWEVRYVDNGFYTIKQMNSDSVLDACGADTTRGTNVQAHTSNGSNAQLWSIFPQNSGYKIQAKCSGYYLDVAGGLTEAGTNVHLWEENETAAQMWSLIPYDEDAPLISDVKVTDVTSKGYTVQCTVNDVGKSGIDRVQFPTWTAENEQDDLLADWSSNSRASGTIDGNKVTFTVNISDHNSEWGVYRTHIYAFDKCGNYTYVVVDDVFVSSQIVGDVNMDGELGVTDVILLQKWLLSASNTHLPNWQAADMYKDNKLNIFDLCLMKRKLLA